MNLTKKQAVYKAQEPLFYYLKNGTDTQKRDALIFLNTLNSKLYE